MMRRFLLAMSAVLLVSHSLSAQTTTIRGTDPSTGADVQSVGDASNNAIRVSQAGAWLVSGVVAVSQSGTWTVQPGNTANSTAWLVTGLGGTFPATQSGTWNIGTLSTITNVVHVDDNSGSLTVDGTVTANLGTLNGAATATNQTTGNASLASLDGKTPALGQALAAGSVPVVLPAAQVSTLTPPAAITGFATESTLATLDGKVTAIDTGNVTIAALPNEGQQTMVNSISVAIASNQSAVAVSGPLTDTQLRATAIAIDGSGVTQPISASTLPLPTGAATSAQQSDGSQKTQLVDGAGNVIGATSNALDINIKSGNPTTIAVTQGTATNLKAQAEVYQGGAAVGSGNPLQVTLANTAANSTAVKVDGSAVTQPVSGTVTVTDGAGALNVIVDSGTVTANAGTNLNTSLLALESGGNLAAALTSLQLIDDVVYTDDTSTHTTGVSKVALLGAVATPTDGSVNANDIGAIAMTVDRKLHVSVQDALPAGSNAIGKLAANSGVDIGDVDVTSVSGNVTVVQGTATNLKAQAEAYQGGSAVGAANPLQVTLENGSVPSHAVTNAGTFAVQESGTHVQADDAAFTPATSKVVMSGAEFDDTSPDSVDEGDGGAVRMSANRNLYVRIRDNAGNERGLNIDGNGALAATVTNATATNLKAQAEAYQGGTAVGSGNPLQVTLANTGSNATAVKVDNSAVTQPVNLSQVNGNTALAGNGVTGTGSPRVTIASDNTAFPVKSSDGTNTELIDPCMSVAPTTVAISQTNDAVVISAVSAKKNYICSITLVVGAAEIINIVEGTGSTCGTSTAALIGSTTDANGLSFAANGGFAGGTGHHTFIAGTGTNVDTCLRQSGTNRVSGFLTYVQR